MNLLHKALYRVGEKLNRWNVLDRMQQLKEMEGWSREQYEAFQLAQLQRVCQQAYEHVPFYKELWDQAGVHPRNIKCLKDLSFFPKTTKAILREAGDLTLNQTVPKSSFVEGRSSGSTGERFVYYKTKCQHSWIIASTFHGWTWAGWDVGDRWIRLQFRGSLSLRERVQDWMFNCLYMPIDNLDNRFLETFVEKAVRFNPKMVRGYAGGTYVFAKFLLDHGDKRLRPNAVVCTGDTLYPHYREAIVKAFDCPVFDAYGGEGMAVANQCANGSMHLLPAVYVELEPEGPEMDDGQPCHLILTSLTNDAMPLIRYDIGDVAISGEGVCPCGRSWPFLKRIVGRETDIVVTPLGRHLVCHHFNNIFREIDEIDQFQIVQDELDRVTVRLVTTPTYNAELQDREVLESLSELGGNGVRWNIEHVDTIPLPPTGKRRYVISSVTKTCRDQTSVR